MNKFLIINIITILAFSTVNPQSSLAQTGLVINEVMPSNDSTIADEMGEYDDWIELSNISDEVILLDGLYLTDKPAIPTRWSFPLENIMIEPGEYLLIWTDSDPEQGSLHTNFRLDADGEYIGITGSDGVTVVDSVSFANMSPDISLVRIPDGTGGWQLSSTPTPGSANIPTGIISAEAEIPERITLRQNFPNPFNPFTTISYSLTAQSNVSLVVYNLIGKEVARLVSEIQPAGHYKITWDASDVASGIYLYRLHEDNLVLTKKMVLLK